MKKTLKTIIIIISAFFIYSIFSNVEAASASISASKKNISTGESTTITVSINAAAWNLKIGDAVNKSIVGNTDDGENAKKTSTVSFSSKTPGSYKISLSGDVSDGTTNATTQVSDSVTVVVSEKSSEPKETKEPEEPTFKNTNDKMYAKKEINVRKSYSASSAKIGSLKAGESITRTGIGSNGWSKVTYNGTTGYIQTSLLTTEEPAKSSDKALKTLEIANYSINPTFDPEITDYTVSIDKDNIDKLEIKAEPNDTKSKVEISGNENLKAGDNIIKITVTAEDATTRIYTINATKKKKVALGLSSLKIDGYTLSPVFATDLLEYKVNILDVNVNSLNISAVANDEEAKVEISGNTSIKQGENTITIKVTSKDGTETITYKIIAIKNIAETTTKNDNLILYGGIGIIVVLVIAIITIIIVSKKKSKQETTEQEDSNYDDLYGYSSKNSKIVSESDQTNKINEDELTNDDISEKNEYENKDTQNNQIDSNQNIEDKKYEDNFNYNPYTTTNLYGDKDYNRTPEDEYKVDKINNDYSKDNLENKDSDMSNYENQYEDYNKQNELMNYDDNDYKPRRSKGKHSK